MDQQQKKQAQFSGAYLLDRAEIETLVAAPAVAAAKA